MRAYGKKLRNIGASSKIHRPIITCNINAAETIPFAPQGVVPQAIIKRVHMKNRNAVFKLTLDFNRNF